MQAQKEQWRFTQSLCSFTESESLLNSRFKIICNVFIFIRKTQHTNTQKVPRMREREKKDHIPAEVTFS